MESGTGRSHDEESGTTAAEGRLRHFVEGRWGVLIRRQVVYRAASVALVIVATLVAIAQLSQRDHLDSIKPRVDRVTAAQKFDWSAAGEQCADRGSVNQTTGVQRDGDDWGNPRISIKTWTAADGAARSTVATDLWCALVDAGAVADQCPSQECSEGKHLHTQTTDLGEEMSHIEGAVVLQRPNILVPGDRLWPINDLDFVKTLQSYFPFFKDSLFDSAMLGPDMEDRWNYPKAAGFLNAVIQGDSRAAMYLSPYYAQPSDTEPLPSAISGYETLPTVVSMADVYISERGYVYNDKNYIVPKSCKTETVSAHGVPRPPKRAPSYPQVLILAQHWSSGYYHFLAECLPRITLMLDVLLEYPEIQIAVGKWEVSRRARAEQFVELLGIHPDRLIFNHEIHADLAFLPDSTSCGLPNTVMVSLLRSALLKGLYPETGGVAPRPSRPLVLLIVRTAKRKLDNNAEVREALKAHFPTHNVVEFLGTGPMAEQLKMFAEASLIVAPHGAGLTNMMVSPLHTPVLEIAPVLCPTCYIHLTLKLQHIYARHAAGSSGGVACDSAFSPDANEIVVIATDLLAAKELADAADAPRDVRTQGSEGVKAPPSRDTHTAPPASSDVPTRR